MASGILRELKRNPSENLQLPFDGSLLEWEVSELHQLALAVPVTKRLGTFEERILASLDTIAGHVAKYAPPGVPTPVLAGHNSGGVQ